MRQHLKIISKITEVKEMKENTYLKREVSLLKQQCRELTEENLILRSKLTDVEFVNRNLLGTPMSQADIAEETAIANGEAHYAKFCGDDF